MKRIAIIALLCIGGISTINAQKNTYVGFAPFGLINNKVRLSLEKEISNRISLGSVLSLYTSDTWLGQKLEFNLRYYLAKSPQSYGQNGIYTILQAGGAIFKTPYSLVEEISNTNGTSLTITSPHFIQKNKSHSYGWGLGMGYRAAVNRLFVDANFRLQFWNLQSKPSITETIPDGTKTYNAYREDGLNFRTIGPGAYFAPTITLGYIF